MGSLRTSPKAYPGRWVSLRFWHRLIRFRHFCSGSLALASLNLACRDQVPTFPQRSPPSLLTTAACGGLRPAPDCRPRRALLHLSYSSALSYSDSAFVTHAPNRTPLSAIRDISNGRSGPCCRHPPGLAAVNRTACNGDSIDPLRSLAGRFCCAAPRRSIC